MASLRPGGRKASELRPLSASIGVLDRADGSSRFSFGSTSALASCSGPLEVRLRDELPERATIEIVHRPLEGVAATPSRALVTTLSAVLPPLLGLERHPRSLIQLVIQSLTPSPSSSFPLASSSTSSTSQKTWPPPPSESEEPAPSDHRSAPVTGTYFAARAAALNASTLSILDTGSISLRALPIAVALAYTPPSAGMGSDHGNGEARGSVLVLDPSHEEEERAMSRHVFAWAFGTGIATVAGQVEKNGIDVDGESEKAEAELVWAESEGEFDRQEFEEAMEQSKFGAGRTSDFIREKMAEHFKKRLRL